MEGEIMHTIMSIPTLLLCGLLTLSNPAQSVQIVSEATEPIERRDVAVYDEAGSITDADALVTTGKEFALSVFNSADTDRCHIQYGDGTQFSIGHDEELIFIIYNGEFMSVGNAVRCDGRLYLPYTILEKSVLLRSGHLTASGRRRFSAAAPVCGSRGWLNSM